MDFNKPTPDPADELLADVTEASEQTGGQFAVTDRQSAEWVPWEDLAPKDQEEQMSIVEDLVRELTEEERQSFSIRFATGKGQEGGEE